MTSKFQFWRALTLTGLIVPSFIYSSQSLFAAESSASGQITAEAVKVFKAGKPAEAQKLEDDAIAASPSDWLGHATKSYFFWHEGNVPDAIVEGQKAARFGADKALALQNLGLIYQQMGGYKEAIPLYQAAIKAEPADWVPRIAMAQAYIGAEQMPEALKCLQDMTTVESKNFAWHYQLGQSYLILGKADAAIAPLRLAIGLAASAEQKEAARADLTVALLQANNLVGAGEIAPELLSSSKQSEIYVRVAATLLATDDTSGGAKLLQNAEKNLNGRNDGEAFFRLGRIFLAKNWLELAARSFAHASDMDPAASKNYLGLAAVMERQGKKEEAAKALNQAMLLAPDDLLPGYLESRSKKGIDLVAVKFQVPELTCNCHAGKIESSLRTMDGVSLLTMAHLKPYEGMMLVDPAIVKIDDTLTPCLARVLEVTPVLKEIKPVLAFTVVEKKPVRTIEQAVAISQTEQYGNVLDFPRKFQPIMLTLPENN